jgi:geranylgeranyl transferase type-2 subunit beta
MFFEMARQPISRVRPSFYRRIVNASRMVVALIALISGASSITSTATTSGEVLAGLRHFYAKTSKPDGSFSPGIDPDYRGMSDSAYSDLAAVTYAVTIHKTFGWKLPREKQTMEFLLTRQRTSGKFYNVGGTVDPQSAEGRVYNTTQGIVALRALGLKPRFDPLPVFEEIPKQDYKTLPPYLTSFFPLAYLAYGRPIPPEADRRIRATMIQAPDGYLNDHIAATFHAVHYYRLIGEPTPLATQMVERALRDQKPDGSWLMNPPARDRHATFDAVFALWQLGHDRADCRAAIQKAARWVLTCRNPDGGFGHFPGSTSDADAIYFHVGVLVMAGFLEPVKPLPKDSHLLSWGHLMPLPNTPEDAARLAK